MLLEEAGPSIVIITIGDCGAEMQPPFLAHHLCFHGVERAVDSKGLIESHRRRLDAAPLENVLNHRGGSSLRPPVALGLVWFEALRLH